MTQSNQSQENETQQEEQPENETLDFSRPDFVFIPSSHEWRQSGPYLICRSCPIEHSSYVGIDKLMVGVDEKGMPIMKTRKELNM